MCGVFKGQVFTDTTLTIPTVTRFNIGDRFDGARTWNGHIASLRYYRKRLPNAKLVTLTSFDPLSLSPALWLSDTGSNAAQWDDLSGNERHATQATGIQQPEIVTNALNGRQVRRFDGGNDYLSSVWTSVAMPITSTFIVFKWNGGGGGADGRRFLIESRSAASNVYRPSIAIASGSSPRKIQSFHDQAGGGNISIESTNTVATAATIVSAVNNGGSALFINGALEGAVSGGIATTDITGVNIGTYRLNDNRWFSGDIAEILVFPVALSAENRQNVERYLSQKYNIALA
jgi:hypothetical protein